MFVHSVAVEAVSGSVRTTVGQTGTLSCEMYGYLRESIEWLKDGQQLQSGGRYSIVTSAGGRGAQNGGTVTSDSVVSELMIQQVEEEDEGTYTCRAMGTLVQDTITLTVQYQGK